MAGGRTDWAQVGTGGTHTCARRASGRLFCWGVDEFGEVGDGLPLTLRHAPREVAGARTDWGVVDAGTFHVCARRSSGRLFCWGHDNNYQLGNGAPQADAAAPVQVNP